MTARAMNLESIPSVRSEGFSLPDGSCVLRRGDEAEIRDPEGRVVIRYANGAATVSAPDGDLCFEAPRGSVRFRAGRDLELEAAGTLRQTAGEIDVHARVGRVAVGVAKLLARSLETTATQIHQRAERIEAEADHVALRARELQQDVSEVARHHLGRLSMLVRGVYALDSRRTVMSSTDDTQIDGKRVLLG